MKTVLVHSQLGNSTNNLHFGDRSYRYFTNGLANVAVAVGKDMVGIDEGIIDFMVFIFDFVFHNVFINVRFHDVWLCG